ncbi:MAG: endonuclease III domain-containing protein [Planifilum sp.]
MERSWRLLWEELVRWNPELTVDEWWEGEDRFFRCLGSVLVQRTTWHNARRAIEALKGRGLTTPDAVLQGSEEELMAAIRPAGFYRSKVPALRRLCRLLLEVEKSEEKHPDLRDRLLRIRGIGPETADTILLYVFDRPVFIGDAYAERIASRWFGERFSRERIREGVLREISDCRQLQLFHALLVELGKVYCRKRNPRCQGCPLRSTCQWGKGRAREGSGGREGGLLRQSRGK